MRLPALLLLAALLPTPLVAQMGSGMGGMAGRRPDGGMSRMGRPNALPKFATTNELQSFNAAEALLKEGRKLKLTDEQTTQLTALRATLYERNADLMVRYDSVRRNYKIPKELENPNMSGGAMPSPEEMSALGVQMRFMVSIAEQLMQRRPEQVAACLALVDDSQRDRARKLLDDQTDDLKKAVPQRPNPDGRR
ncbi:MAG: hypothetical protein U5K74_11800 [Gemmatimonadaceae bacterium]|nr:hypothetical protein [Gemmatimonadaceae bacterium]